MRPIPTPRWRACLTTASTCGIWMACGWRCPPCNARTTIKESRECKHEHRIGFFAGRAIAAVAGADRHDDPAGPRAAERGGGQRPAGPRRVQRRLCGCGAGAGCRVGGPGGVLGAPPLAAGRAAGGAQGARGGAMSLKHLNVLAEDDDDPMLSAVNLVDVFLVLVVALLTAVAVQSQTSANESVTIIRNAGQPDMEVEIGRASWRERG